MDYGCLEQVSDNYFRHEDVDSKERLASLNASSAEKTFEKWRETSLGKSWDAGVLIYSSCSSNVGSLKASARYAETIVKQAQI